MKEYGKKLSDLAELWLADSWMAVAKALIPCPATGWGVRLTASLLAPEASLPEDKSGELSKSLCCLDHPCPQQGAGVTVASGIAYSGDLEHFLLEA